MQFYVVFELKGRRSKKKVEASSSVVARAEFEKQNPQAIVITIMRVVK